MMTQAPSVMTSIESISQLQQTISENRRIVPVGNCTKNALTRSSGGPIHQVCMNRWTGIVDYQPAEFTITAKSGTRIEELIQRLAEQGQYLPFEPTLVSQGATLGGTVASGISGSGRLLYGGLRDFILGVQMVDGLGRLVRGGGKVVKNAAGFDLPKMMVGSLGRLGVLTEVTLKVFPRPHGYRSLLIEVHRLDVAIDIMGRLGCEPIDICSIDFVPNEGIWIRVAGDEATTQQLVTRIERVCGLSPIRNLGGKADAELWNGINHFQWGSEAPYLVKIPTTLAVLGQCEQMPIIQGATRRYVAAGNALWLRLPSAELVAELGRWLHSKRMSGLVVLGEIDDCRIGLDRSASFATRIQSSVDPDERFVSFVG